MEKEGSRSGGPSKKHIRTTTNLLVDLFAAKAFGYNQYATNYRGHNGHGMYRQVSKNECIDTSPGPKDNETLNNGANGAEVGPNGTDDSQNWPLSHRDGSRQNGPSLDRKEGGTNTAPGGKNNEYTGKDGKIDSSSKLHALVQHIYAAQARVQLEVAEIKKAQAVASAAQDALEEASNNVRVITAAMQTAQQAVAAAAVRAQTAQLRLAAHDQLLFAARQKVDALSAQMVGLQAEDGIFMPNTEFNVQSLYNQLREPLPPSQTPTAIPPVDNPPAIDARPGDSKNADSRDMISSGRMDYEDFYSEVD